MAEIDQGRFPLSFVGIAVTFSVMQISNRASVKNGRRYINMTEGLCRFVCGFILYNGFLSSSYGIGFGILFGLSAGYFIKNKMKMSNSCEVIFDD